jgi:hypothetical protein
VARFAFRVGNPAPNTRIASAPKSVTVVSGKVEDGQKNGKAKVIINQILKWYARIAA